METKLFATRLVERLRKRSAEYNKMAVSKQHSLLGREDAALERAVSTSLNETADCIEETITLFEEVSDE